MTSAPTMLSVWPIMPGMRAPDSRSISNTTSMNSISSTVGKGTPSRACEMLMSSGRGSTSGWKATSAT